MQLICIDDVCNSIEVILIYLNYKCNSNKGNFVDIHPKTYQITVAYSIDDTITYDGINFTMQRKGNYMAVKRNLNAIVLNEICYESNTKIFELKASGIDNVGESKTIKALFDSKSLKLLEYIEIQPTNKQNFEIETRGTEVNAQRRS